MRYRVLQVEDSSEDALLNVHQLQREGLGVESERVQTGTQMRHALHAHKWDLILCDHHLPQFDSFSALSVYREIGLDIPFIVVSGCITEEQASQLTKAGAHACLAKEDLEHLALVVKQLIQTRKERKFHKPEPLTEAFLASIAEP